MGEIKRCLDCRWVRIWPDLGERYAQCACPALTSDPDPVTGERTMGICRYLRNGGPLSLFGGWLAPCGTKARHYEAISSPPSSTTLSEGGV